MRRRKHHMRGYPDKLDLELAGAAFALRTSRKALKQKPRPTMRNMCAGCDSFKLCKDTGGAWLCAECAPAVEQKR